MTISEEAQDEPESDSVYDFLYHDIRRVGSYLAQFDDAGHLQSVIESRTARQGVRRGWKATLGIGDLVPGLPGGPEASLERGPLEAGSETSERVYEPLWTNARTLLDYLDE